MSGARSKSSCPRLGKGHYRVSADCHIFRNHAILPDQESDRGCKNPVFLGKLPLRLNHHGEIESELFGLVPIFICIAASYQHQRQAVVTVLLVEAHKVGSKLVAGSAMRITEHQEYAPAAVLFE